MTETTPRDPWFDPVRARPVPVALVAAAVVALLSWRIGLRADLPAFLVLAVVGTMLGFIDAAIQRLPDKLTLPGAAAVLVLLGFAALFLGGGLFVRALVGMAVLTVFYFLQAFLLPGQVFLGDVKLALALGLVLGWLGPRAFVSGVVAIHVLAGVWAVKVLVQRRKTGQKHFAFGPFMLLGTLIAIFVYG